MLEFPTPATLSAQTQQMQNKKPHKYKPKYGKAST